VNGHFNTSRTKRKWANEWVSMGTLRGYAMGDKESILDIRNFVENDLGIKIENKTLTYIYKQVSEKDISKNGNLEGKVEIGN